MIKRLTKEQATIIMAMTGVVMLKPSTFKKEIEKKLNKQIFSAEFATPIFLMELKKAYMQDFLNLCYVPTDNLDEAEGE